MSPNSRHIAALLVIALLSSCGKASSLLPTSPGETPRIGSGGSGILVGAGDIGNCATTGAEATARLLDHISGTVFAAGDNAYMRGTRDEYQNCYEPTWGRHRSRTRPVPGNHEYMSAGAAPYYEYFGGNAGPIGDGYYSYAVGAWRVIALNSEIPSGPGSPQSQWLRGELSSGPACTAVIWHRPLFSSGLAGNNPDVRDLWRTLYELGADLVINGHDHTYERFAPQDPDGRLDQVRGIREFVVGTGGAPLFEFPSVQPNSEARAAVWGVAVFTLFAGGYQWEFVPVEGESFRDSGSGACH
jgi:calcineurin-like phosphoesterase family protein